MRAGCSFNSIPSKDTEPGINPHGPWVPPGVRVMQQWKTRSPEPSPLPCTSSIIDSMDTARQAPAPGQGMLSQTQPRTEQEWSAPHIPEGSASIHLHHVSSLRSLKPPKSYTSYWVSLSLSGGQRAQIVVTEYTFATQHVHILEPGLQLQACIKQTLLVPSSC